MRCCRWELWLASMQVLGSHSLWLLESSDSYIIILMVTKYTKRENMRAHDGATVPCDKRQRQPAGEAAVAATTELAAAACGEAAALPRGSRAQPPPAADTLAFRKLKEPRFPPRSFGFWVCALTSLASWRCWLAV